MKKLLVLSVLATMYSVPSHALVRLVETCHTANGEYTVVVTDNQGIGPVRKSSLSAAVQNQAGDVVASYAVEKTLGMSISFGRTKYVDVKTQGEQFTLAFPSTNYRHTTFSTSLVSGEKLANEEVVCRAL